MILKHAVFCKWVVEMSGSSQDLMAQLNFYGVGADPSDSVETRVVLFLSPWL